MAGGAPQGASNTQGRQLGATDPLSSLLQNPNLPSMLQNANFSGISQPNQQALMQAYQRAQNPMQTAMAPTAQAQGQMSPQMMQAAQNMQSQSGSIGQDGTFTASTGLMAAPPQLSMNNPNAGQAPAPNLNTANPVAQGQMSRPLPMAPQGQMSMPLPMAPQGQGQAATALGGPDMTGVGVGGGFGFDGSGSDGGIGGRPVNQRQSPMGGRPSMLSDFRNKQGLQIQGNPTAQQIQRGLGALGGRRMR